MQRCLRLRRSITDKSGKFPVVLWEDIGYNKSNLKCAIIPVILNLQIL